MKMLIPVKGKITSKFGDRIHPITGLKKFHNGVDISAPEGTEIKSPSSGIITKYWFDNAGGKSMQVKHENGFITGYAHLQKYGKYKVGDKVTMDSVIGYVGSTGKSTGPHLHFTVRKLGKLIDPLTLINLN